jgi:hypothetical protein
MSIKNLKPNQGPNGKYKQGYFQLKNPQKYVGDPNKVIFRSSWEYRFMQWCDIHPKIVKWGSEPVPIPYINPVRSAEKKTQVINNYYIDFYMVAEKDGKQQAYLVEVKPEKQKYPPDPSKLNENCTAKRLSRYNQELKTYLINQAKWAAAKQYAASRGMLFKIADENFLF